MASERCEVVCVRHPQIGQVNETRDVGVAGAVALRGKALGLKWNVSFAMERSKSEERKRTASLWRVSRKNG